ncbi:MAG TPA: class I adenylate-forming enzyme family protein [Opitutaceae bacterium]|nr:class I adenylate-forming enzyme family protein [Opitutaceae bacterium]
MSALLEAWDRTLRRHGDDRAIVQARDGQACTFRELGTRADAWRAAQVPDPAALAGRLVVFAVSNSIAWFEVFLGLLGAGAIAVPLDPGEPVAGQQALASALRAGFWWDGERLVPVERARRFRHPSLCLVKLTSGSTGRPRPLFFTAAQMLADGRQVTSTMGIRARDLNYALIPFGHSYGLGNLTLPLLAHGVPLVCGAAPLPQAIAEDFARWQPSVFPSVPAVWRALASADLETDALRSLRVAISAGAPLPPEVAQAFVARFRRRIHSFYGSSETGGIAYDRSGAAALTGGVGRAMRGVRLTALRGGRLRVCSAAVFTQGNATRDRAHGCWSPPDFVQRDARGNLTLLGRRGTTVKIAGRRINLAEVTARLRRLARVRDAWVGTIPGAEPVLGAAVASDRSVAELRAELQADTPLWKIPKKWSVLAEFPLTARGKTDTPALRARVFGTA